jgi:hypothetical protein
LPIAILALVLALIEPTAGNAEIVSVPPADPPSSAAAPPPPTVLRGSPLSIPKAEPICPPGYTLSPGYGCVGPAGGDYASAWPGYDYWPDYGFGYPFGGFPGFGFAGRFHRHAGFHGFHGLHASTGFHGRPVFHSTARVGGFGIAAGHTGGFGRR